ncbi:hypothetical protein [Streptomyces sp. NPDC003247]|uniref:hypothetical protein n=1 Tax=Streptomyces sp. NPDC003247 TaxID=3364677 RepID=UPI0036D10C8F
MDLVLALLASLPGAGAAVYFHRTARSQLRRANRLHQHSERLGQQLVAAEQFLGHMASSVVPAAEAAARAGQSCQPDLVVPSQLVSTPIAGALGLLTDQVCSAISTTGHLVRGAAQEQLAQSRVEAERRIAQARQESVDVARAAVRAFASSTVQRAAKLSSTISAGVRRHVSDDAYATLVEIDHLAQQMLSTASGYAVLAGDKLSRRWPATTLTDIVRAAMGRVEAYQRIQHTDMDSLAVESRAVEAVVHSLAVLLDNALRYSPPNARVHVSLEHGANAAFLVVDDAGLRMEDERLSWAREVMAGRQHDDITQLGAYPQTGLRVASVLAGQYGFRVELTAPSLYGGTRAVIVLPQPLLTTPRPAQPLAVVTPSAAQSAPAPLTTQAQSAPDTTASGLTVRRRTSHTATAHTRPAPAPVEPGSPAVAAAWMEGSRRGRNEQGTTPSTDEGR